MTKRTLVGGTISTLAAVASICLAAEPTGDASVVTDTPGLVAFWMFGEDSDQPRQSSGTAKPHALEVMHGPISRVEGGPFSGYAAQLDGSQWFQIAHDKLDDLNISGPDAQVSMFAVVYIEDVERSRTIAGIWNEGKGAHDDSGTRQYAMLTHMPMYGGARRLTPHISAEGGVTRRADGSALPWNADYASPVSEMPERQWFTLGFTYDGKYIRVYQNGVFEPRVVDPEKDNRTDRYFMTEGPDGGHRGMNPYYHGRGIFRYDPEKHEKAKMSPSPFTIGARHAEGRMLIDAFRGRFGGLAVFDRALSDDEMKRLHDAAGIDKLNR